MRVLIRPDWASVSTIRRTHHVPVAEGFSKGVKIISKLKTAAQMITLGKPVADVCLAIEVTQPTSHHWKQHYGWIQAQEAKQHTQLEKENASLKKFLAEAALEMGILYL